MLSIGNLPIVFASLVIIGMRLNRQVSAGCCVAQSTLGASAYVPLGICRIDNFGTACVIVVVVMCPFLDNPPCVRDVPGRHKGYAALNVLDRLSAA